MRKTQREEKSSGNVRLSDYLQIMAISADTLEAAHG